MNVRHDYSGQFVIIFNGTKTDPSTKQGFAPCMILEDGHVFKNSKMERDLSLVPLKESRHHKLHLNTLFKLLIRNWKAAKDVNLIIGIKFQDYQNYITQI